jgi:hypothetical protein
MFVYKILIRKPERKRELGRPGHRWKDNIKVNLKETEYKSDTRVWTGLIQNRISINTVTNFRFHKWW